MLGQVYGVEEVSKNHGLVNRNVTVFRHPPYSRDLAQAELFLFPHFKLVLKGLNSATVVEIQQFVVITLKASKGILIVTLVSYIS